MPDWPTESRFGWTLSWRNSPSVAAVGQSFGRELAGALVALCLLRHYAWAMFPPEVQGSMWKAASAVSALGLLWLMREKISGSLVLLAAGWFCFEELQTFLCSVAYAVEPWFVPDGAAVCSAKAGFDFGAIGLMFAAYLAWRLLPVRASSYKQ